MESSEKAAIVIQARDDENELWPLHCEQKREDSFLYQSLIQ